MKKGIFILATLLSISCGKKNDTSSGKSDQNKNIENNPIQTIPETQAEKDYAYLKELQSGYIGSDLYGFSGIDCFFYQENKDYLMCNYKTQNINNTGGMAINIYPNGRFQINKYLIANKYECNDYPECDSGSDSRDTCKKSYKNFNDNVCDIIGFEQGSFELKNNKTLILKSEISRYKFVFTRN